jgi:preprotein translocase subunit SecY
MARGLDGGLLARLSPLKTKVLLTLIIIAVYRLGTYVPLPFVSAESYSSMLSGDTSTSSGLLGVVNAISGGAVGRNSVFSLNVMPYIVASIIAQLFFFSFMKEKGKERYNSAQVSRYTRYLTVLFAIGQGLVLSLSMSDSGSLTYVALSTTMLRHCAVISTLVAGTLFLVWLGEIITTRGLGNGVSIIIFTGIVAELPKAVYATLELGRVGAYPAAMVLLIFIAFVALVALVVFVERSARDVPVHYSKRPDVLHSQQMSHIPIKINMAGVIPAIFANTVMLAPLSLAGASDFFERVVSKLAGTAVYHVVYFVLVVFFAFFYTAVVFNPTDVADNLRKSGGIVAGMRPGAGTAEYIGKIVNRLTCVGALYLASVCVLVDIARVKYSIPFALGGTSVLILVGVVNDVVTQIQLQLFGNKYNDVIRKVGLRGAPD